jgi:hypothetical protein
MRREFAALLILGILALTAIHTTAQFPTSATSNGGSGGSGTPGGSDTQIQINQSGAFGADSTLTFNATTKALGVQSITIGNGSAPALGTSLCGTAPSAPATGYVADYCTSGIPSWQNPTTTFEPVVGIANPSDSNYVAYIDTSGFQHRTTPSGGGGTPVDSTTSGNGYYPLYLCSYCGAGATPTAGSANGGSFFQFATPTTWTLRYWSIPIQTASGTSCTGGTCGLIAGIYNAARTTALCVTEVGTSGNGTARLNINTTNAHALAFASGSDVTAGVCTIPAGVYWLITSSDSTALTFYGAAGDNAANASLINPGVGVRLGYTTSVTTGNGASLAFGTVSGALSSAGQVQWVNGFIN